MKKKYITRVKKITEHINKVCLRNVPNCEIKVTEKTVRRHLGDGTLVHEPRSHDREPFSIDVNSMCWIDPDCDLIGYDQLAAFTGWSPRSVKTYVQDLDSEWPADWLFGRCYFNSNSFMDLKKKTR